MRASVQRVEHSLQDGLAVGVVTWNVPDGGDHVDDLLDGEVAADVTGVLRGKEERVAGFEDAGAAGAEDGRVLVGLVVSTQALEVSLCLDFDCGASEHAPVEAIAQRAGRVNRRGLHPDGPAEFRVHAVESSRPYDDGAMQASVLALRERDGKLVSEQAIDQWLECAYQTPWGQQWAGEARRNRQEFAEAFLAFTEPFVDRSAFAAGLDKQFDTVEVLLRTNADDYRNRAFGEKGDELLAADLLIPISWAQKARLESTRRAELAPDLGIWLINAPYDSRIGLNLTGTGSTGRF